MTSKQTFYRIPPNSMFSQKSQSTAILRWKILNVILNINTLTQPNNNHRITDAHSFKKERNKKCSYNNVKTV